VREILEGRSVYFGKSDIELIESWVSGKFLEDGSELLAVVA